MYCSLISCALHGIDGLIIEVEVDINDGLPSFDIVGLPDSSVREAKERVRSAIKNSGYPFPVKRITVNLAPADYKKEGSYYDLPIALGILCCSGVVESDTLNNRMVVGELSLSGNIRSVKGMLPIVSTAKNSGLKECIIPKDNLGEASLIRDIDIIGVSTLQETILHLNQKKVCKPFVQTTAPSKNVIYDYLDFADVSGQENVKRALEIAASGNHNVLMIGAPGSGKTMMANRLPGILPDLSFEESIEITKIHSICGQLGKEHIISNRPFRAPHHTISPSALVGGGRIPKPGEVSLSHHGVLFLDELLEFKKSALEILRQPLESREVTISRVNSSLTFPADFMLVASTNPCPCGFYPNQTKCQCSLQSIRQYLNKLSGPLLDRIDIHIEIQSVPYEKLNTRKKESSKTIRERVLKAIEIQKNRYRYDSIIYNSQLTPVLIDRYCYLGKSERDLLSKAFDSLSLTARSYHRIIKLARTIADLEGATDISIPHISEAIQYRSLSLNF